MELERSADEWLREALAEIGFVSGDEFYLPVSAVGRVLQVCRDQSLAVAGIEAFTVKDDKLKPDLDLIADFSSILQDAGTWDSIVDQTLHETIIFVGGIPIPPDRWLNFTLLSEDELQGTVDG